VGGGACRQSMGGGVTAGLDIVCGRCSLETVYGSWDDSVSGDSLWEVQPGDILLAVGSGYILCVGNGGGP